MSNFVNFTIRSYININFNPEDTYENKEILLTTPISLGGFKLPSMDTFSKAVGQSVGLNNLILQKTPTQYVSLIDTFTGIEIYRQEYITDDNFDMLSRIYRNGVLRLTINRGNYYDTPRKSFSIPEISLEINSGVYKIEYLFFDEWDRLYYKATGLISIVDNKLPLKKWTVTDVVTRCLELAEPLRKGDIPRYRLDGVEYGYDENGDVIKSYTKGSLAEKYDKIIAPEFVMTKQTLREQLKQVGGFIHAEPRLKNGIVYFDEYGKNTFSSISKKKYISAQSTQNINDYCTSLDSQADNMVNRLDYAQGVVIEPFSGGFKSVRTESTLVRIEENNGIIATQKPIMEIEKVLVKYPTTLEDNKPKEWSDAVDITPYIFESAEYENLSSFSGAFPYSKEYALTFTQGQKNISGLFFKAPNAIGGDAWQDYAITKILTSQGVPSSAITSNNYALLSFQISYIPIFSERVKTNKAICVGGLPRSINYNQSANLVESRYYGENLKGVVARLGNIDKTYTYKIGYLSDIPKAGDLFDKDYYISAVSVEIQPFFIKVTVGLSKDFNRLSEYVGISSNLRLYEVSEKQAFQRDTVYTDYIVVTNENETFDNNTLLGNNALNTIKAMFTGDKTLTYAQVNQALIRARNIKGRLVTPSYAISLPVVSSALGNQMTFSFNCEDNYSAGQQVAWQQNDNASGYFGTYVPYADYYGRAYYLEMGLYNNLDLSKDKDYQLNLPMYNYTDEYLPENSIATTNYKTNDTTNDKPILYRKDSREVTSFAYQISIVAGKNDIGLIIGSGFARNCSLVNGKPITNEYGETVPLKVYFFQERLPQYEKTLRVDIVTSKEITTIAGPDGSGVGGNEIKFSALTAPIDFKSWAIATPISKQIIKVSDEDGNETTQEIISGGELVIGRNVDGKKDSVVYLPKLVFTHDIYDRWNDD